MSRDNPTPEELDKLSNGMAGKPRCDQCGAKCANFSALVNHLRTAHPDGGSTNHG